MTRFKFSILALAVLSIVVTSSAIQAQKLRPKNPEPIREIAGPDYKSPEFCSDSKPNVECSMGVTTSSGGWNSVAYDTIRLVDGRIKYVIICNDETGKPKPCWTPPPPHPETLGECLLRRYRAYERAFDSYVNPSGRGLSRSYTSEEKDSFIRTMAALDESGKDECKGKVVQ